MRNLDRSTRLFGAEGIEKIRNTRLAIVGIGGLGTHVVQQTVLLGTTSFVLIDDQILADTDLNRYVGVTQEDVEKPKVLLAERMILGIEPTAKVQPVEKELISGGAFSAIKEADVVFGCLDNDGARLVLTELCAAYGKRYFDLASDVEIEEKIRFGGRVISAFFGNGCPVCLCELDLITAREDLETPDQRWERRELYGIDRQQLDGTGPAVVSLNGIIASLAVTEFMLDVTGIRKPYPVLTYRGDLGVLSKRRERERTDCYYCEGIWGRGDEAGVERYLPAAASASAELANSNGRR